MELADDVIDLQKQVKLLKKQVSEQEQAIAVLSKAQKTPTTAPVKQPKPVDEKAMEERIIARLQVQKELPPPAEWSKSWLAFPVILVLISLYLLFQTSHDSPPAAIQTNSVPTATVSTPKQAPNKSVAQRSTILKRKKTTPIPKTRTLTKEELEILKELESTQ